MENLSNNESIQARLRSIPWFYSLTQDQIDSLVDVTSLIQFDKDTVIIDGTQQSDSVYIVLSGNLILETQIPIQGYVRIGSAEPLDIIGWDSLTPIVRQINYRAIAIEEGSALRLDPEGLLFLCNQDQSLGFFVMHRVVNEISRRYLEMQIIMSNLIMQKSWNRSLDM